MAIIEKHKSPTEAPTPDAGSTTFFIRSDTEVPALKDSDGNVSDLVIPGDASGVTYTPSEPLNWTDSVDPGNVNDALDDLALRVVTIESTPAGALADGDYGDITVSGGGTVFSIDAGAVTASKLESAIDLSGKTSLAIPTSAAPTVDANGEIAADTTVTDFSHGIPKIYIGEELGIVAMPIAQFTTPTDKYVVAYDATADEFQLKAPGTIIQVKNTQTGAVSTGTTIIPIDDTIPQNTEGDEYMSLAITPKSASNNLKIDVVFYGAINATSRSIVIALFQDSTANALAAISQYQATANGNSIVSLSYFMAAGTTSSTTFKLRAGPNAAGTLTFNGNVATRHFGGVAASSITITEIVP